MILSREAGQRFPEILETKENLRGVTKHFPCRRLWGTNRSVVVLHELEAPIVVAGVELPAGTLTFGHFWQDRPYNVYHWMTPTGETLGLYFNIAGETRIEESRLFWKDLTLDVLVWPGRAAEVLDRDELPPDLPAAQREAIEAAVSALLSDLPALSRHLESEADRLWPVVFGQARSRGARS